MAEEPDEEELRPEDWLEELNEWLEEEDVPLVPELLHSFEHDGPFRHCVDCSMPLEEQTAPHSVQKVYRKGEVVMEFALCDPCHEKLLLSFSEETKQKLNAFFEEHADAFADFDICTVCSRERKGLDEFNVTGLCFQGRLIQSCCLCLDCMLGMQDLISKKTRDSRNDFINRNFPGVPANVDSPVLV